MGFHNRVLVSFLALALGAILTPVCGCHGPAPQASKPAGYSLVFERFMFWEPLGTRFAITAYPEARAYTAIADVPAPVCLDKEVGDAVERLIPQGRLVRILDASGDGKRLAVLVSVDEEGSRHTRRFLLVHDANGFRVEQRIGGIGDSFFFVDKDAMCYFDSLGLIRRSGVPPAPNPVPGFGVAHGSAFFMNKSNGKLIVFTARGSTRQIIEIDPAHADAERVIGTYKDLVYDAGVIDPEWAYFATVKSPKGGPTHLYFLDLRTYKVVKYPHDFPEARLVCASSSPDEK
jgi:hypothetical protein